MMRGSVWRTWFYPGTAAPRFWACAKEAITSLNTKGHGYEIDFVLGDALDEVPWALIQVCESMDDERTAARELRALWEAMEECGLTSATLVVGEGQEETYRNEGFTVRQVPAWKWLLG